MASSQKPAITRELVASIMDATLLKPESTRADVADLVTAASELGCGAVCVSPSMLPLQVGDSMRLATVVGFPSGKHQALIKATEARFAVEQGAAEIDVVIDLAAAVTGDENAMLSELITIREAVPRPVTLKVILESAVLSEEQLRGAVRACIQADVDYVKTSTGFHPAGGATVEAVEIMADELDRAGRRARFGHDRHEGEIGIKASGGIRDWDTAIKMIEAGATRLGVSAPRPILDGAL